MLFLIENGEVYAPEPRGLCSVLPVGERVGMVGEVDRRAASALGLDLEVNRSIRLRGGKAAGRGEVPDPAS